jgi:hypothetical protein
MSWRRSLSTFLWTSQQFMTSSSQFGFIFGVPALEFAHCETQYFTCGHNSETMKSIKRSTAVMEKVSEHFPVNTTTVDALF